MDKVSFVIPAYNAAKTLRKTVCSIERLDINCEIIIVENGSKDATLSLAEEIRRQYDNVIVFRSEKGVSKARNVGIEKASGEWIIFVDADDVVLYGVKDAIESVSIHSVDLYIGSYLKDAKTIKHKYSYMNAIIKKEDVDPVSVWMLSKPTLRMQVWAKVFRRKFLVNNRIKFNEELSYSEDSEFLLRVLNLCSSMVISDVLIYQYISCSVSAMRSIKRDRMLAYIHALRETNKTIKLLDGRVKRAYIQYSIAQINIVAVHDIFAHNIKASWKVRCKKIEDLMNMDSVRYALMTIKMSDYLHLSSLPILLFRYRLYRVGGTICYLRSIQNTIMYNYSRKG